MPRLPVPLLALLLEQVRQVRPHGPVHYPSLAETKPRQHTVVAAAAAGAAPDAAAQREFEREEGVSYAVPLAASQVVAVQGLLSEVQKKDQRQDEVP